MTKSLMISIHKKHADNIKNKLKTLELRTWLPKLNGLKGVWIYIYEPLKNGGIGAVIGRFWFDEYETYNHDNHGVGLYTDVAEYNIMYDDLDKLCLDYREVENYGKGKDLYAWHIKQLEVFDEPKELGDFESRTPYKNNDGRVVAWGHSPIIKAPQKMAWVYTKENEK